MFSNSKCRQLYSNCKKYRPIISIISTKNRCSVYVHLISKTAEIEFDLNLKQKSKYYMTSVKEWDQLF